MRFGDKFQNKFDLKSNHLVPSLVRARQFCVLIVWAGQGYPSMMQSSLMRAREEIKWSDTLTNTLLMRYNQTKGQLISKQNC